MESGSSWHGTGGAGGEGLSDYEYATLISSTDADLLKRSWHNEKASPQNLQFQSSLVQRTDSIDAKVPLGDKELSWALFYAATGIIKTLEWVDSERQVRLTGWQQGAIALGSAVGALVDPIRADLIAALGETTEKPAFKRVLERMKRNPKGRSNLTKVEREEYVAAMGRVGSSVGPSSGSGNREFGGGATLDGTPSVPGSVESQIHNLQVCWNLSVKLFKV